MSNSNHPGQVITFQPRGAAKRDLDLQISEVGDVVARTLWGTASAQSATRTLWGTASAQSATRTLWGTASAGSAKAVVSVAA